MTTLIGTAEIAKMLGLSREYVTDEIVKMQGFPDPAIDFSNKTRKWHLDEVEQFLARRTKTRRPKVGRRSARPSRGNTYSAGSVDPGGR